MPLQLRSNVTSAGQLELSLTEVEKPVPSAEEVLIRVDATPINPSDLGVVLAMADTRHDRAVLRLAGADLRQRQPHSPYQCWPE